MKKLISIAFLLASVSTFSQVKIELPVTVNGIKTTLFANYPKTVVNVDSTVYWYVYKDTTVLNYKYKDTIVYRYAYKDSTLYNYIVKDTLITQPPTSTRLLLTFTQRTDDYSRTGAGAGQWHGGYEIAGIPQSLDRYDRLTWYMLEPTQGNYTFTELKNRINAAIDKGQMYQFGGVMSDCPGCDLGWTANMNGALSAVPSYLLNSMPGAKIVDGSWLPDYNSEAYLSRFEALLNAINQMLHNTSYKGVPYMSVVNEIDIRGYGRWGEWNKASVDIATPSAATLKRIIIAHTQAFYDIQLIALIAAFDGGKMEILNIPAEVGNLLLTARNAVGKIGWRRDSFGDPTAAYIAGLLENSTVTYNVSFKDEIMNRWKYAPVRGESVGFGNDPTMFPSQIRRYHVGSFGNGNFYLTPTTRQLDSLKRAAKEAGYRLTLVGGTVSTGSTTTITLNWSNIDRAPTYDNWDVIYQVSGVTIGKSSFNPRLFTGTTTVSDSFTGTIRGQLTVKVVDPSGYRQPMTLGITGQNSDKSYTLTTVNL
jgi:hypothetical protein